MEEDTETQKHAKAIAHDYNFAPFDPLKCERVIHRSEDLCSLFLCNTSNRVKVLIQYHADQVPHD